MKLLQITDTETKKAYIIPYDAYHLCNDLGLEHDMNLRVSVQRHWSCDSEPEDLESFDDAYMLHYYPDIADPMGQDYLLWAGRFLFTEIEISDYKITQNHGKKV